mmetsp:Transcript_8517/g.10938  ORF Transcript_8517/g.10938 Transcript_8517/m.10938 type:complete len:89 (-) Transcript_8517:230-496(-)
MKPQSIQFMKSAVKGGILTFSWTMTSCMLALAVEKFSHRALYRLKPELYDDVKYAYGLDLENKRSEGSRIGVHVEGKNKSSEKSWVVL